MQFIGPVSIGVIILILAPLVLVPLTIWAVYTAGRESDAHPCVSRQG